MIDVNKTAQALARAAWRHLLAKLKDSSKPPSVDLLQVARQFLVAADFRPEKAATRAQLEELYRLYLQGLQRAIEAPMPSAATFSELRKFLDSQGVGKDLEAGQALEALGSAALPFTGPTTHQ
jgi:hypothetical protein